MKRTLTIAILSISLWGHSLAQTDSVIYAFCIAAPKPDGLAEFVRFVDEELGPHGINTLILRVDFNYAFTAYPNLSSENPLTDSHVQELINVARKHHIQLIPQINLLGHQSWAETTYALLKVYPQFDETPHVIMPATYTWPNEDGLYCKSYCPRHPEVHEVVFSLVDEVVEAFEAKAFHAGMDEVFYLGDDDCPRCAGADKAALFAGEVTKIRDHLAKQEIELWIWGDRLIDAVSSGLGIWEASGNGTVAAIGMIPRDVVINDWHYNNAVPTPAYFATHGLSVVSCFWNKPAVATSHMEMMKALRDNSPDPMKSRMEGVMQTVWSPAATFLDVYYGRSENEGTKPQVASYRAMIKWMDAERETPFAE